MNLKEELEEKLGPISDDAYSYSVYKMSKTNALNKCHSYDDVLDQMSTYVCEYRDVMVKISK